MSMRRTLKTPILTLALAGAVALPAAFSRPAAAEDSSSGGSVADKAMSAGESAKDAATNAGSAVKDSAKSAAGYVSDTAKNATARVGGKDSLFVREAAIGGMTEVKSAELAKDKASSEKVKSFAEKMVQDHTKANQELEQLAKEKGITVPTELDSEHQAKIDKLSGLQGTAFDKAYLQLQRSGHEKMLRLMKDEATNGKDADIKTFAQKTEKVVAQHHASIPKLGTTSSSS